MANRIFMASYKDISKWGERKTALLNTLEKDDAIFLIQADEELNNSKKNLVNEMKKKCKVKISDMEDHDAVKTGKKLLHAYLEKKKDTETFNVYIIGESMKPIYHDRAEFQKQAEQVFYHYNFQVKNLKPEEVTTEKPYEQMDLFAAVTAQTSGEPVEKPDKKETKAAEIPVGKPRTDNKRDSRKDKKHVSNAKKKSTIEREVFTSEVNAIEYEEAHTEIQDAKALLAFLLLKRFKEHIKKLLFAQRDSITLTDKQVHSFILILLKVEEAEEFNESWKASETDPKIELNSSDFLQLRGEARYYNQIAQYMYGEDKWDD